MKKIMTYTVSIFILTVTAAYSLSNESDMMSNDPSPNAGSELQQQQMTAPKNTPPRNANESLSRPSEVSCVEYIHRSTVPVCFIHPGFTFDAGLVTSILSFNTITPVIAETEFDILHLGKVLFPKGTLIIGESSVEKTLDRVNIKFNTIVYPNGRWITVTGIALHTDGSGGIPGKVKKEKAAAPARILLRTAGAATAIATQQPLAGEMVSGIASETEKEISEKQTYSIKVKKGMPIMIYVSQEISF